MHVLGEAGHPRLRNRKVVHGNDGRKYPVSILREAFDGLDPVAQVAKHAVQQHNRGQRGVAGTFVIVLKAARLVDGKRGFVHE